MHILGGIETDDRPVGGARGDDRDLALESDETFEDERHAAECGIGAIRAVGRRAENLLALAVITETAGLQHALAAEILKCRLKIGLAIDRAEAGG